VSIIVGYNRLADFLDQRIEDFFGVLKTKLFIDRDKTFGVRSEHNSNGKVNFLQVLVGSGAGLFDKSGPSLKNDWPGDEGYSDMIAFLKVSRERFGQVVIDDTVFSGTDVKNGRSDG
jgi:hypothetical protein